MIEIKNLTVTDQQSNELLSNVSLKLIKGSVTALTGASGSGKTTLANVILGVLPEDLYVKSGNIFLNKRDINHLSTKEYRKICGKELAYIPQLAMRAFDPRKTLGKQILELYYENLNISKAEAMELARKNLQAVNLDYKRVLTSYPMELSGGMLQRSIIAIILGLSANYIIADEPTSALDEYNSSLFYELLEKNFADRAILLITHDGKIIREKSNYCYIMQQGKIIEEGKSEYVFKNPKKNWTKKFCKLTFKNEALEGSWQWSK